MENEPGKTPIFPVEPKKLLEALKMGIPEKGMDTLEAAKHYAIEARTVEMQAHGGELNLRPFSDACIEESRIVHCQDGTVRLALHETDGRPYLLDAAVVLAGLWSQGFHASNDPTALNMDTRKLLTSIPYYADRNTYRPYTIELVTSEYSAVTLAKKLEHALGVNFWAGK